MKTATVLLLKLGLVTAGLSVAEAADWPIWRGPNHDGISLEKGWRSAWVSDPKVLWNAEVGVGFSAFTVADGKVFTTGYQGGEDSVFCLDAQTGKILWKHSYPSDLGDKYYEGGTSATPVVDEGKVFHLSRWGDLFCLDAATGKVIWEKNVQKETDANIPDWGFAGAPLVQGNLLILNVGSAGMAVDKTTGNIVWKSETDSAGYSTPYPVTIASKKAVVMGNTSSYFAVEVETGAPLWSISWRTRYGVNASDPIVSSDLMFISTGYNKGCAVFKLGEGEPEKVWESKVLKNMFNSSVLIDGYLYGIDGDHSGRCELKCISLKDGKQAWGEKSIGFGSLMAADGKLIILTEKGELVIAKATPDEYTEVSRSQILGGRCWSVPILSNGRIYARNAEGKVVCLDVRE